MANRQKYTRSGVGHLLAHYEREKDKNGNYLKFGNTNIDTNKSYLNYNLAAIDQPMNQYEFLKKRMEEVYCLNRKDVNVMVSWVISLPENMNDKPDEQKKAFFQECYNFLKKRYGKENVISSYVHLDENQPHMHFAFTPVCFDKKKQRYSFNAKIVGSKKDLLSFHNDLDKHLTHQLNYETGVITGTTEINLSIKELKSLSARQDKLEKELEEIVINVPKTRLGYVKAIEFEKVVKNNQKLQQALLLSKEQLNAQKRVIELLESDRNWKKYKKLEKAYNSLKYNYDLLVIKFETFYKQVIRFVKMFSIFEPFIEYFDIHKKYNDKSIDNRILKSTALNEFDRKYNVKSSVDTKYNLDKKKERFDL